MLNTSEGLSGVVLWVLAQLLRAQTVLLDFAWAGGESFWIMTAKRVALLLPAIGVIVGLWILIPCMLSLIIRQRRSQFIQKYFLVWWDLGRAIFTMWGGMIRFAFYLVGWLLVLCQMIVMSLALSLQDLLLAPLRLLRGAGEQFVQPGVPWGAVLATVFWCLLEATIFTVVMTPLVVDVFSNMTGTQMETLSVQIPLFFVMFTFILGSYAVLANWVEAIKTRDVPTIIQISAFEIFVLFFEVVFLYREFVDALVPWFAQHTRPDFQLGIFMTLLIAGGTWMAFRSVSWFLFAHTGTPTIMAIIQRSGLPASPASNEKSEAIQAALVTNFIEQIKKQITWVHEKGDELLGAFVLPPLQVLAVAINFLSLLISSKNLFEVPFKSVRELAHAKKLLQHQEQSMKQEAS